MRNYIYPTFYNRYSYYKVIWAKNQIEAAEMLGISINTLRTYSSWRKNGKKFKGVRAYFDSGPLVETKPQYHRKLLELSFMHFLIDEDIFVENYKKQKNK